MVLCSNRQQALLGINVLLWLFLVDTCPSRLGKIVVSSWGFTGSVFG